MVPNSVTGAAFAEMTGTVFGVATSAERGSRPFLWVPSPGTGCFAASAECGKGPGENRGPPHTYTGISSALEGSITKELAHTPGFIQTLA